MKKSVQQGEIEKYFYKSYVGQVFTCHGGWYQKEVNYPPLEK